MRKVKVGHIYKHFKGDMYIITKVITPKKLDRKQKALFKDLAKTDIETSEYRKLEKYL